MYRILLMNPPGPKFQRGEDRCQADIEHSAATTLRPPNNLAYLSAILKKGGYDTIIRDYPAENKETSSLFTDLSTYSPSIVIISVTEPTLFYDLEISGKIKMQSSDIKIIFVGAFFRYNTYDSLYDEIDGFKSVDYIIYGENEPVVLPLVEAIQSKSDLANVKGIYYSDPESENHKYIKNGSAGLVEDLDSLPFPDRDNLKNRLYIDPLSNKPIATIEVSRGCPSSCIYCLAPVISGRKLRMRSVENVIAEIKEVKTKQNIDHFFFRADTFSINNEWVNRLLSRITDEKLDIRWVANARVDTVNPPLLKAMKEAGCYLVALGIESGSDDTLRKIRKGYPASKAIEAIDMVHEAGLKIFGFFMIGFPWEDEEHIKETKNFILRHRCDFIEVHIATPYIGTQLYDVLKEEKLLENIPVGNSYFNLPAVPSKYLPVERIKELQQDIIKSFYLTPSYIIKKVLDIRSLGTLKNYYLYGMKLVRNLIKNEK